MPDVTPPPLQVPGRGDKGPNVISGNPQFVDPTNTGGRLNTAMRFQTPTQAAPVTGIGDAVGRLAARIERLEEVVRSLMARQ